MSKLLESYAEAFGRNGVNPDNYAQSACYLQGLRDGMMSELSEEALSNLNRCIETLQGGANLVYWLRRLPEGKEPKP